MATRYWLGTADAVAQVDSTGINVFDATTTYGITINGSTVSVAGDTDEETTTDALIVALNASTNPYFSGITWLRIGATTTSEVQATADNAGMPFTITTYANGGTGSWNAVVTDTANSGPNVWDVAANWSGSTVPVSTDDVVISDSAVNICWGLDQSAVDLTSLTIKKTYTGRIGLDYKQFATNAEASTVSSEKAEYRENYLKISATTTSIGEHFGPSTPAGSTRILLDLGTTASTVTVYGTAGSSSELGRPALRLLATNASTSIFIQEATGGVGIAAEEPGETSTVSQIRNDSTALTTTVEVGVGTTVTTYYQANGTCTLQAAADVTTATVQGGILTTAGDFGITTMNMEAGTYYLSNDKSGGNAVTTLNLNGGTVDTSRNGAAKTVSVLNLTAGTLKGNDALTITTINEPTKDYTLVVS